MDKDLTRCQNGQVHQLMLRTMGMMGDREYICSRCGTVITISPGSPPKKPDPLARADKYLKDMGAALRDGTITDALWLLMGAQEEVLEYLKEKANGK